jgi:hypothetical protein
MSGDVHPLIRKQSPAEANAEYDDALDWLQNTVGSLGRFETYRVTFSRVFQRVLENRAASIPYDISPAEYVEMRFEANALVNIWRQFQSEKSPLLREKLRIVVRGATLTSSEGQKTEPRDILFELETGALFKSWGLPVQLGQSADLSFEFNGVPVLCECKRVQTPNAYGKNFKKAASQLRDALKEPAWPQNTLGMIAIDVSQIVHLDVEGFERYPPTAYGAFSLPSNMVAVLNEVQFKGTVKQRLVSFTEQHQQVLRRDFVPRVSGFMLCYNIPAVDLKGSGRTFVVAYPQIGSFTSATPAERKYFENFHSVMLDSYRRRRVSAACG